MRNIETEARETQPSYLTCRGKSCSVFPQMRPWTLLGIIVLIFAENAAAFKAHDFKTCSQSGFCRRGRALAARARESKDIWKSPYSIVANSVTVDHTEAAFSAQVKSSLYPGIKFGLELRVHEDGVVRIRMDEIGGLRKRYDEAASWALISEPKISQRLRWTVGKKDVRIVYGEKRDFEVVVSYEPLRVTLLKNGKEQVVLNDQGLLHMEHFRNKEETEVKAEEPKVEGDEGGEGAQEVMKQENPRAWFEGESEDAYWEESFSTWTDTKPKGDVETLNNCGWILIILISGPESLSLDITFPNHGTVYGIPQHATRLALPTTSGEGAFFSDPYRLYNADVFEYLASSPVSLYGSIPIMHAHSTDTTVGIFNAVASETWIDVSHVSEKSTDTHWISESGILDLFLLPGPSPKDIFTQYSKLTGTPVIPPHWSLGYHQCRWNYISSDDVRTVQKRFDEDDIPLDVLWLDIEYAEEHKYFIWDKKNFPDPVEMVNDISALGRKVGLPSHHADICIICMANLTPRWSSSLTLMSNALPIIQFIRRPPTRAFLSSRRAARESTRVGAGLAAVLGLTFSILAPGSGGKTCSNLTSCQVVAGRGLKVLRMSTFGMT